jgi:hypothetical protein
VTDPRAAVPGDADGPGKDAKIGGPAWVTVDGAGTIYFVDTIAKKVKAIAADAERTVSTVATLDKKVTLYGGMTLLDGKLYLVGAGGTASVVVEVDPKAGKVRPIREGGAKAFPPLDAHAPSLTSIASDGKTLLVSGAGYIWRLSKDGRNLTLVAGTGFDLDYPPKYNPAGVYPVKELFLRFRNDENLRAGASTAMVWSDNALYFRARHLGGYVLKIGCP